MGNCKFYKLIKQVSYDNGQTWQNLSETRAGDLYERDSADCMPYEKIYRWENINPTIDYVCDGTTKYYKQQKQVSYDNGENWQDVIPSEFRRGGVYEYNSEDCVFTGKLYAKYTNGSSSIQCNGDYQLLSSTTHPSSSIYSYKSMTEAIVGDCVRELGNGVFGDCVALTSVTLSDNITYIGKEAFGGCRTLKRINSTIDGEFNLPPNCAGTLGLGTFYDCTQMEKIQIPSGITTIVKICFGYCSRLTSVDIPEAITEIGEEAFKYCTSLQSVTVRAITPPKTWINTFANTNNTFIIYVPAQSVEAYKSKVGWSSYADQIQAIP